jgi:uncharacterized protein (DUF885 family)
MPSIDSIAADYVERAAALDPFFATVAGIAGHDDELPDLSADGLAGRAELDRSALAALQAAETPGPREQVARAAMQERLAVAAERYDAGDTTSELNVIDSWVQYVREVFDLMPTEGEEGAVNIARRMAAVPEAYRQFSRTLLDAARNGRPPARLQAEEVARQCASAWMQELAERTISELNGKHFDIPAPALRIEALIAPVNNGGIYYTGPSEDWSRPGRMWWSVPDGVDTFGPLLGDSRDVSCGVGASRAPCRVHQGHDVHRGEDRDRR